MIDSATPEQWEEIARIRERWISSQTDQVEDSFIEDVVVRMWASMGHSPPKVEIVASPTAAAAAHPEGEEYFSVWWRAWAGWYEGAKYLGVEFDMEKYNLFRDWAIGCLCVRSTEDRVVVSRNPVEIHWDEEVIHNPDGIAVKFADGTGRYVVEGVLLNEQIVMLPETQTIKKINDEPNEEVRRLRIDGFGWNRYIKESGATILDENQIGRAHV